ncbi:MAG: hypothetical protein R3C14_53980 [Caldilineaceae bacterium]
MRALLKLIIGVIVLLPFMESKALWAHGGGTPQLTDVTAGPYRLYVWTQPAPLRVGDIHLSIAVLAAQAEANRANQSDQAVTDATVTVLVTKEDGAQAPITAVASLQPTLGVYYYEADLQTPATGAWHFLVKVEGSAGAGQADFVATVFEERQLNWPFLIGAGLLLIVLLGLIGVWNRLQAPADERRSHGEYQVPSGDLLEK